MGGVQALWREDLEDLGNEMRGGETAGVARVSDCVTLNRICGLPLLPFLLLYLLLLLLLLFLLYLHLLLPTVP